MRSEACNYIKWENSGGEEKRDGNILASWTTKHLRGHVVTWALSDHPGGSGVPTVVLESMPR